MAYFLYTGFDLMASPNFDFNELPLLRGVVWYAQQMARIGNWLSTWKRELREKDLSSGVFAYLLSKNLVSPDNLLELSEEEAIELVDKAGVVEHFLTKWRENYWRVEEIGRNIKSVDIKKLLKGLENLLKFHLATEGYK